MVSERNSGGFGRGSHGRRNLSKLAGFACDLVAGIRGGVAKLPRLGSQQPATRTAKGIPPFSVSQMRGVANCPIFRLLGLAHSPNTSPTAFLRGIASKKQQGSDEVCRYRRKSGNSPCGCARKRLPKSRNSIGTMTAGAVRSLSRSGLVLCRILDSPMTVKSIFQTSLSLPSKAAWTVWKTGWQACCLKWRWSCP